jgi:hypothetical protein
MSTSVSVLPVTGTDISVLADFLYTSKLCLSINRLLYKDWPNESAQRPHCASVIKGSLADPSSECLKAVDAETGDILGFVVLTKKIAQTKEEIASKDRDTGKSSVPEIVNPEVYHAVMKATAELRCEEANVNHFGRIL